MHKSAMDDVQRFSEHFLDSDRCYRIGDVSSHEVSENVRQLFHRNSWNYVRPDVASGQDWLNVDLESFDVIVSVSTMEQIHKPWEWIKKLSSRLKPSGLIYIYAQNTLPAQGHPLDCWRVGPMGMNALFEEGGILPLETYLNGNDTVGIGLRCPVNEEARIRGMYAKSVRRPSDIWEHLPYLRQLGSQVKTITEFGTRHGISTIAFLASKPEWLCCYDIHLTPEALGIGASSSRVTMHQANVLEIDIDPVDLLFIDTWHTYEQLRQEFRRHAPKARKFIVLHDTTSFGTRGEDGGQGLWPAVEEFLKDHPEWAIERKVEFNNGLTTLRRCESTAASCG
ncbi:MAG TPA: class I SAM-dependent methyltransferase [Schlesneria sp.]|jgi:cephalosporin hydroxylase